MAIDITQSEKDSSGTPPLNQEPLSEKYTPSGMTCHILEPRSTTAENNSPNNNSSNSYETFYFNNWTVNQQQPTSTLTFAQPQFYTSTILPERNNPNVRASQYQELQCRPSVPQSQYSNPSSQEWSGSDFNTHSSSFGWTNRGIVKTSQSSNYSNFYQNSFSGKWQDSKEKEFGTKQMANSKRPRITFTNKQIVELEKDFQLNK